ncbi:wax ester/triacylglycerol synthase domain-containing protein [Prescottella subtropica]|uniref:wax ester/triacylglycerol synthase domain-containing protein n=1 Tax=Prescottella subtropica TaxID=2545757 RepID=UPI0010F7FD00|nr:wax ester/triacylglycerol synthase domain-containing protein [Prescottella subtropica]
MTTPVHYRDALLAYTDVPKSPQTMLSTYIFTSADAPTATIVRCLADRVAGIAPLHQRMVRPLGDIGTPYWSDTPRFEPESHIYVHETDSWEDLCALLPTIQSAPFDWSRPLWELHVIRGVQGIDGRSDRCDVVSVKMHHSCTDGMGIIDVSRDLFSERSLPAYVPGPSLSVAAATVCGLVAVPRMIGRLVRDFRLVRRLLEQVKAEESQGLWQEPPAQLPRTVVNHPISTSQVVDAVFFTVSELRVLAREIGDVTVNDVVLAIIGGAMAKHLGHENGPLVAAVPISTRGVIDTSARNQTTSTKVDLHVEIADPAARAKAVHHRIRAERDRTLSPANAALTGKILRLPGFLIRIGVRVQGVLSGKADMVPGAHFVATSVQVGNAGDWQLCGSSVVASIGVATLVDKLGVAHRIGSIGDQLTVTVTADPRQMPDLDRYIGLIRSEYEQFAQHTVACRTPRPFHQPRSTDVVERSEQGCQIPIGEREQLAIGEDPPGPRYG